MIIEIVGQKALVQVYIDKYKYNGDYINDIYKVA